MSDHEEFTRALARLPPPISCFSDGAACPWCGCLHATVTFGHNECQECGHGFLFGYPQGGWHEGKDPISWVEFPWRAFDAMGQKASALKDWKPNERLQRLYFQKSEEALGIQADTSRAN